MDGQSACSYPGPQAAQVTVHLWKAGVAALSYVLHTPPPLLEDLGVPVLLLAAL